MTMRRVVLAAAVIAGLGACKAVPEDVNRGELIASEGVRKMFAENPEVDSIQATGDKIRCVRHRRVGTHLIMKICRTRKEWEELQDQTQDTQYFIRSTVPCVDCGGDG